MGKKLSLTEKGTYSYFYMEDTQKGTLQFDKKYVVATMKHPPSQMIWDAQHHYEWTQVCEITQREAETTHAQPWLHDLHAKWCSLSPVKGSHLVPEGKQDLCAGMAQEQPRSQSNREHVDYYDIQTTV